MQRLNRLRRALPAGLAALFLVLPFVASAGPCAAGEAGEALPEAVRARVVSIGGATTEILYALGLEERVVAVDVSSTYPPAALATRPNVGYIRALSAEGVLSVGPTLILAQQGAGPPDVVAVLKGASVPFETLPEARTPEAVLANIRRVAALMGVPARGEEVAGAVGRDFAALAALRERIVTPRRAAFILSATGAAPVVGGAGSSADALFHLAGIVNAMSGLTGYKPAVDEALMAAAPDALILMADRGHGLTDAALAALPGFAGTPAVKEGRIFRVDGGYALNFGPRTPQAARDLMALVYPELDLPALPAHGWTRPANAAATPPADRPAIAAPAGSPG
ncbi:heme/hemin ABC transporter substrate-binding protein [Ancylobacter lacus]|uniref:heme/hemin ABC transporter substrate-binding protein n=1 Tax=Ancylobacter lacus TaxID=2579970 RepID=UPI001BCB7442|nr:ABC transporter substrate-binding protein [Ancylobacter lacus]MBS7540980.1 ABC transporter substrate-binding protein [Ancylobacter lacus]